jgi:serine/threonine protein kinase
MDIANASESKQSSACDDPDCLKPGAWLNRKAVFDGISLLLTHFNKDQSLFHLVDVNDHSGAYSLDKHLNTRYWLMPDNPFGNHWILIIVPNPQDLLKDKQVTFLVFDSVASSPCTSTSIERAKSYVEGSFPLLSRQLNSAIHHLELLPPRVINMQCPQQSNDFDCGLYVITFAHHFLSTMIDNCHKVEEDIMKGLQVNAPALRQQLLLRRRYENICQMNAPVFYEQDPPTHVDVFCVTFNKASSSRYSITPDCMTICRHQPAGYIEQEAEKALAKIGERKLHFGFIDCQDAEALINYVNFFLQCRLCQLFPQSSSRPSPEVFGYSIGLIMQELSGMSFPSVYRNMSVVGKKDPWESMEEQMKMFKESTGERWKEALIKGARHFSQTSLRVFLRETPNDEKKLYYIMRSSIHGWWVGRGVTAAAATESLDTSLATSCLFNVFRRGFYPKPVPLILNGLETIKLTARAAALSYYFDSFSNLPFPTSASKRKTTEVLRIEKKLGEGQFGVVYACRKGGIEYAAKRAHRGRRQVAPTLECKIPFHPNVVRSYGLIKDKNGRQCYIMDRFVGSLEDYIYCDDGPCLRNGHRVIEEMFAGLHHVHKHGLWHRDLKPDNILLKDGKSGAALTDFGLAVRVKDKMAASAAPLPIELYRAPELFISGGCYSDAAEVFALGAITYEFYSRECLLRADSDIIPTAATINEKISAALNTLQSSAMRESRRIALADFLPKVLDEDPKNRLACKEAMNHPLFLEDDKLIDLQLAADMIVFFDNERLVKEFIELLVYKQHPYLYDRFEFFIRDNCQDLSFCQRLVRTRGIKLLVKSTGDTQWDGIYKNDSLCKEFCLLIPQISLSFRP